MNRVHTRLAAVLLVVLGLFAVAGCGSRERAGRSGLTEGARTAPAGTILFTRIRTDGKPALFTIAADGSGLRLFATHASSAAVLQGGQQILFVRRGAIWLMRRDGSGQRQVTRPRGRWDYDPAWSPSGEVVYFSGTTDTRGSAAFSMRLDGTMLRRLTHGCVDCIGGDDELAPSPDGRIVAYTSWDDSAGSHYSMISAMTPAGREAEFGFETTGVNHEWSPAWAPDGESLAFAALDNDAQDRNQVGRSGIYVSTRTAPARRVFRPGISWPAVRQPAWSSDGRWIAFTKDRGAAGRDSDIWLVPADGGPARRVTSGRADDAPTWLPPVAP